MLWLWLQVLYVLDPECVSSVGSSPSLSPSSPLSPTSSEADLEKVTTVRDSPSKRCGKSQFNLHSRRSHMQFSLLWPHTQACVFWVKEKFTQKWRIFHNLINLIDDSFYIKTMSSYLIIYSVGLNILNRQQAYTY